MNYQSPFTITTEISDFISEPFGFMLRDFLDASVNALQNAPVNFNTILRTDQVSDQVENSVCRVFRHTAEGSLKTSTFHFGNNCDTHCGG